MNLTELQREAHAIAKDHGWWDEERTFGDLIALVHSELSEALEEYRERGIEPGLSATAPDGRTYLYFNVDMSSAEIPDDWTTKLAGVPYELADVVIRVVDMAEYYGVDLASLRVGMNVPHDQSFGDYISFAHEYLSGAYSAYRIGLREGRPNRWGMNMAWLVMFITVISERYGINLDTAITAKMEYNRGRSYRHGGKAL